MTWDIVRAAVIVSTLCLTAVPAWAQAVAGPEKARPVKGDPGMTTMVVIEQPQFRVLRDYSEPGAVRRMHNHPDTTYHVLVLITGQLQLTVEGQPMVEVRQGEALSLPGGAMHTFVNTGKVTATIVEVFGKGPAAAADLASWKALAEALAPGGPGR